MALKIFDFRCTCGNACEALVGPDEEVSCDRCGETMQQAVSASNIFGTIVPTYPGAQARKAGYVPKHRQRAAEKIQMGAGGGVSPAHAKGRGRTT